MSTKRRRSYVVSVSVDSFPFAPLSFSPKQAVIEGLKDGTLDCIVTDHAPHTAAEKSRPFPECPSGMVGLETSLALSLTVLHHQLGLPLSFVIDKMSTAPAKLLHLPKCE